MKPSQKRTHGSPKRNALPTIWDPEPNALCTEKKRVMHPNGTHCTPKWNALRTGMKYAAHPRKATSLNAPCMENETRSQPCEIPEPNALRRERDEPNALRRERDEPHHLPLRDPGHKKSYLSNLSSLHLQLACPTSWWEKPAHATRKNQNQNRSLLAERPILTGRDAWTGRVGGKNAKREKGAWTMQVREPRMAETAHARR